MAGIVDSGFEALLAIPVESACMDVDRKTVWQIVVSAIAVALFIAALIVLSSAYGVTEIVDPGDNEGQLEGSLSGDFDELTVEDGTVTGTFTGEFENDIVASFDGSVDGTVDDGVLVADFDGTITGAIDGDVSGEMNGTLDEEAGTFEGTFSGTATGETRTTLSPEGGLMLLGLIALFILLLPVFGYLVERQDFDEDDE